jgi:hypothetical protein
MKLKYQSYNKRKLIDLKIIKIKMATLLYKCQINRMINCYNKSYPQVQMVLFNLHHQ